MQQAKIFEEIYRGYIRQVGDLGFNERAEILGITVSGENARIPVFNRPYRVGPAGVEHLLARTFSGNLDGLSAAAARLGGVDPGLDLSYDIIRRFHALPKIPLLLLFNDAEEGFPADGKVLLEQRAEKYLDMECLAILGMMLAHYLSNGR